MSLFRKLSMGFKSPEASSSPAPPSPSQSELPVPSTISAPAPPSPSQSELPVPSTISSPAPPSPSQSELPVPSTISESPKMMHSFAKDAPFEFWKLDLTVESVDEAKSKLLNLNAKDPYGETALIRAARHGDAAVTKALIDAGAAVNSTDRNGETALSWAAQMGKTGVLKILVDCPDVQLSKSDQGGRSALHDACCCQFSNVDCVELLLERGAQPNSDMLLVAYDEARLACILSHGCEPEDIPTFLHHCIRSKGFVHPDLDNKRFLPVTRQPQSSATPDSNPVTNAKQAAMAQVSSTRKPKQHQFILEDWIKRAGDADCPDAHGMTLLMNACGKANINAVQVLIRNGANVNAQDANGRHAIHYAAQRFHPSTLKAMKIAEMILNETNNEAINLRDKRGTSPLMQACQKGHIESVNMLMDRAQSIGVLNDVLEASDNRGYNVLHHAAENLLPRVIRHLLSSQPQLARILNFRTTPLGRAGREDATPLHLAIVASFKGAGGLETCITLADFGCSLRVRNLDGFTGLELLEKFKKSNNELWQWAFMQDRAEQGGAAYVKQQSKLAHWLLESCSVRSICGSASAKRWLEAAAHGGDKPAADKLAELSL